MQKEILRTLVFHMETEATLSAKLRKQKTFGNTTSSNLRPPTSSSQCHPLSMKPHIIELLVGRPNNHISIVKVFVLLSLIVLLFTNVISSIFDHNFLAPPILYFSSFAFSSNSNYSSPSSFPPDLNSSLLPSDSNFSASTPLTSLSSSQALELNSPSPSTQLSPKLISPPPLGLVSSSSPPPTQTSGLLSSPPPPPPSLQTSSSLITYPPPSPPSLNPLLPANPNSSTPPPSKLHPNSSSTILNSHKSMRSRAANKDCDLSQGEWVRDWEAPYYTNMTCYTIQEHQNCMKYGRPNMDFLKWRWKPDGCELPLFDPNQFLELMRGKTLAFVGDSLARNQMQSLMCLLSQVVYPEDISETSDDNFKRMYYSAFNFTISIYWSPFLISAKQTRGPEKMNLWNFYLDEVDDKWASHLGEFDNVIISGGNWFNRPSIFYQKRKLVGCLYCPSKKVTHRTMHYSHRKAFRTAFQAINKSIKFKGRVILRTVSPAHFENGVWDKGGDCVRTKPFRRNETNLTDDDLQLYKAQLEEFQRAKKEGRKKRIEYRLLDTTNPMLLRPDGHPSRYGHWPEAKVTLYNDCVHWCLPGPVDMWNDVLLQMLSF